MATSGTSTSRCSCLSKCIDISEAHVLMREIVDDLLEIKDELELQALAAPNQTARACKVKAAMIRLEGVDSRLCSIYNSVQVEPEDEDDDLVSNFSVSVKLDIAQDKLRSLQEKHCNLRKEWHSQNEHLNKLLKKINDKEAELRNQSVFCTAQGLILSKMLWKLSNTDVLLDEIVSQEKLIIELVKVFGGCLYGFVQTYGNEMPEPSADEYQYVLCLCGLISNLATVPDGRFFLTSQPICRQVFDEMIKILPRILIPNAESLKWIMLSAIYNLMICKEGEEYAKNNTFLVKSLVECIKPDNPARIIVMALKILDGLTNNNCNQKYMKKVSTTLPLRRLQELQQSKDSCVIRKQAKHILSSLMNTRKLSYIEKKEKLIGVTHFDQAESQCPASCKKKSSTGRNRKLLTYYVFANSTDKISDHYTSNSSSRTSSLTSILFTPQEECTSFQCSSLTEIANLHREPQLHSAPPSLRHWKSVVSFSAPKSAPDSSLRQFAEKNTATPNPEVNNASCMAVKTGQSNVNELNRSTSEEIQSVQYQFPYTNLSEMFTVTIGDNLRNPRNAAVSTVREEHHTAGDTNNTSIVTVYQISNSRAILFADSSFMPVSTHTQTCSDRSTATARFSRGVETNVNCTNTQIVLKCAAVGEDGASIYSQFDAAYERAWYKNLKSAWLNRTCILLPTDHENLLDLPSTSTGLYECERYYPHVVPIDGSSVIEADCETSQSKPARKTLKKRCSARCRTVKRISKKKKGPCYKVLHSRRK